MRTSSRGADPMSSNKPIVLFDLGQTLVDLRPLVAELARVVATEYPSMSALADRIAVTWIVASHEEMPRRPGAPFASEFAVASAVLGRLLRDRGPSIDTEGAGRLLRRAWDAWEHVVTLCPGVTPGWLAQVRQRTAGMGIVTDGDDENVSRLVRKLRLGPYFDTVVTSESVRLYKPNPAIYQVALERLHAEARRGLFVSDTPLDLEGAHAAGMAPALLARRGWPSEVPRPPGAIALSTPDELLPVLDGFRRSGRFEETHGIIGSSSPA